MQESAAATGLLKNVEVEEPGEGARWEQASASMACRQGAYATPVT